MGELFQGRESQFQLAADHGAHRSHRFRGGARAMPPQRNESQPPFLGARRRNRPPLSGIAKVAKGESLAPEDLEEHFTITLAGSPRKRLSPRLFAPHAHPSKRCCGSRPSHSAVSRKAHSQISEKIPTRWPFASWSCFPFH